MVAKSELVLNGMKEICAYVGRSETTVLGWIRNSEFPAKKTKKNGVWMSNRRKVDAWLNNFLEA